MSDNDPTAGGSKRDESPVGDGGAISNVPLRKQGGPTGADLGTTGGGGEGGPGNVLGGSGGVGGPLRRRPDEASDPKARGDRSPS